MKELILFYSRAGENYNVGTIEKGNTQVVAEKLAALNSGDLFKVEPVVPYSDNYKICIDEAQKDLRSNARPAVKAVPENIEQYDLITVMYPNYWGTMPMHMFTVLEQLDFSGKTVRAICTHEGSGLGGSERDLKKVCVGANFEKGLAIQGSSVSHCDDILKKWNDSII